MRGSPRDGIRALQGESPEKVAVWGPGSGRPACRLSRKLMSKPPGKCPFCVSLLQFTLHV